MTNYKKKSNAWKGVAVFLAIAVAAAYIVPSAILNQWNPAKWGEQTSEQPDEIYGGGMVIGGDGANNMRVSSMLIAASDYAEYGVSPMAETAYALTATVLDEEGLSDGIPQNVTYSCAWANASSEWATGKDIADYYKVTSTGINTANAECLQAFGEPIIITATSDFNEDAYCTWQADYVKRVENVELDYLNGAKTIEIGSAQSLDIDITYGIGTITGDFIINGYHVDEASTEVLDAFKYTSSNPYTKYFYEQADNAGITPDFDMEAGDYSETEIQDGYLSDVIDFELHRMALGNMSDEDVSALESATDYYEYLIYALNFAAEQSTNDVNFSLSYKYTYNGNTYSSGFADTPYFEIVGSYPAPASVSGNDVDLIY